MSIIFGQGIVVGPGVTISTPPPPPITSGALYTWGRNVNGQLGINNTTDQSSPRQVGSLTTWSQIASTGGANFGSGYGIKTDGTLWSWGRGSSGILGLNNTTYRSSPVQVGSLTNWLTISAGYGTVMGIKTDGTLWSWGNNAYGQLGQSDAITRSSPTQVGSSTNWATIAIGRSFAISVQTNGTIWSWGRAANGQLGLGAAVNKSSPTQIGSDTNWVLASSGNAHTHAIKTTGTLWSWGDNSYGRLGLSPTNSDPATSSPIQVGSLTTWSIVTAGPDTGHAIKTDGTLWGWGSNSNGQVGNNGGFNVSSPVQIGSDTIWANVNNQSDTSTQKFALAVKTDGTLWSWGMGTYGQLGLSSTSQVNFPTQIGGLTSWLTGSVLNTPTTGRSTISRNLGAILG